MKKLLTICCVLALLCLPGCSKKEDKKVKVGVSFGVGEAARWPTELKYMKERANELGIDMETRLNKTDIPKTQEEDCKEMIDSGIDVLILTPRDINNVRAIIDYAKEKNVKVISYARASWKVEYDLFIGYDTYLIGKDLGKYVSEKVYEGDYIILKGDENDYNSKAVYDGMMKEVNSIKKDIQILLDEYVEGWDPLVAKELVKKAVKANGNKVDVILAPNDKLAGASIEALEELGIDPSKVVITGMDAEVDALKRIIAGKQSVTEYMDLKALAQAAVDRAETLAKDDRADANSELDNESGKSIKSYLINGKLIAKENLDNVLIDSGFFKKEDIYGK